MRLEMSGEDLDKIAIFRMDREALWFINVEEKTYLEITKQDLEAIRAKMENAMKMYEEQMKNMPPEQREMMAAMMKDKMPEKAPEISYKKTASGEKVNQWVCDKYEGYAEGKKHMDIWTADWKRLGLDPDDFKVMQEMGEFFKELVKGRAPFFFKVGTDNGDDGQFFSGLPIKTIVYSENQTTHTTEIMEMKEQEFAPSLFELPEGFKKEELHQE